METLIQFADMLLHIDRFLDVFIQQYGVWVYVMLFAIVFCETGLVVTPFLPGDSLLFIGGAFCASGMMSVPILIASLLVAAILGNTVNYRIGRYIGPKVFDSNWRWLDRAALLKTRDFYEQHGGKTIVIARFMPIVRTFAPFIAGVCAMRFVRFQMFNLVGALLWVLSLVGAGYFFGNLPFIKQYLNVIVLVGISAAVFPLLIGWFWRWLQQKMRKDG